MKLANLFGKLNSRKQMSTSPELDHALGFLLKRSHSKNTVEKEIAELRRHDKLFAEGRDTLTDEEYDALREKTRRKYPDHDYFKDSGVESEDDEPLPIDMPGLTKIRPDSVMPFVTDVSPESNTMAFYGEKIDGISVLLKYTNRKLVGAWKKGKKGDGRNIMNFVKYITDIPREITYINRRSTIYPPMIGDLLVRAELAVSYEAWRPYDKQKIGSKKGYATPRIMASSIFNRSEVDQETITLLKNVSCVVYSVLFPEPLNARVNNDWLYDLFPNPVYGYSLSLSELGDENIVRIIKATKNQSPYPCDGIVISVSDSEKIHQRAVKLHVADQEPRPAVVRSIEVNMSTRNLAKPTIIINPVMIDGVKVSRLTGNNMREIETYKLGPGSKIHIVRSGDVIPHLLTGAEFQPTPSKNYKPLTKCPDCGSALGWTITANGKQGADRICYDSHCLASKATEIFLERCGIKGLGTKIIYKLIDDPTRTQKGNQNRTVSEIFDLSADDFTYILGAIGKNIYNGLWDAMDCSMATIMYRSGIFSTGTHSLGEATLHKIITSVTSSGIITEAALGRNSALENVTDNLLLRHLPPTNTTHLFVNNLGAFSIFYRTIADIHTIPAKSDLLAGKSFAFTGFRDQKLVDQITSKGGEYTSSVTKKTTHLVYKYGDEPHPTKAAKAKKQGCELITSVELVKWLTNPSWQWKTG